MSSINMRPAAQNDAHRKHLENAASLLLSTSPSISAHLRLASDAPHSESPSNEQGQSPSCSACGNILLPGWSCNTLSKDPSKRTRKDRIEKRDNNIKTISLRCLSCNAVTLIESAKPAASKTSASKSVRAGTISTDDHPKHDTAQPAGSQDSEPPGLTSRKRGRGKKPTLQSMLSEQQTSVAPTQKGFGLGLMDFMKT